MREAATLPPPWRRVTRLQSIASLALPPAGVKTGAGIGEQPEAVRDAIATEDLAALGIDQVSDLEVIEELELLEFLADRDRDGDRERAGEGPRG